MAGKKLIWGLLGVSALVAGSGAMAQGDPEPSGSEFQINTSVLGDDQGSPRVAADGAGGFVAVWEAGDQDGKGIFARRFDPTGKPLDDPFQVNQTTKGHQEKPSIAGERDGDFVIVWQGMDDKAGGLAVFARVFDEAGDPVTGEATVNANFQRTPTAPVVAVAEGGDFLVLWQSLDSRLQGTGEDVFARRFDDSGTPEGGEFQLNQITSGDQTAPAVAARRTSGGGYLAAWQSPDADDSGIFFQLIGAGGQLQWVSEKPVNTEEAGPQLAPAVAASDISPDPGSLNRLVVVFQGPNSESQDRIWYRLFTTAGAAEGSEKQVDSDSEAAAQREPAVAMTAVAPEGLAQFVASWTQVVPAPEAELLGAPCIIVGARRPRAHHGLSLGDDDPEFPISTPGPVTGAGGLGMDAAGNFVAVWKAANPKDGLDLFGRLFATPLFNDGFETGDFKLWSQSAPVE